MIKDLYGERVRIHINRNKGMFVISKYSQGVGWRVEDYAYSFRLTDVDFHVSQAGNLRAREIGERNVHAYMYGTLCEGGVGSYISPMVAVTYNPFKHCTFIDEKDIPIYEASEVHCWSWNDKELNISAIRKDNQYGVCSER